MIPIVSCSSRSHSATFCDAEGATSMQKPRPKQAPAPEQQRPTRDDRASTKGASAPLVVPRGENAINKAQKPTPTGTKHSVKPATSEPAVIVFGRNAYGIPQAAWFPANEADLATRAAQLMGLRVLKIENDTCRELAAGCAKARSMLPIRPSLRPWRGKCSMPSQS